MKQRIVALGARPEFWLACLLAWLLMSACRSLETPWARAALTEALRWGAGIGLMLTLGIALRRVNTGVRVATIVAALMVLAGIWDGFQSAHGGVVGPYQDHQLYGSALLILLPVPVALALSAREAAWRRGATAIAAACAVCLVLSQTRSAWAGAIAAALVFTGLWLYRSGQTWRQGRLTGAATLVLLGGLALLWTLTGPAELRGLVTQRAATLSALRTDASWQTRLTSWRGAVQMAELQPLIGYGLGRYPGAQYRWTQVGQPLLPTERPTLSEEAHSFYLQTAAETGLFGLGLYLAALVAFSLQCLRHLREGHGRHVGRRDALLVAMLSVVAGQAVDAVASPSWQFAETSLLFWALLGLGMAAQRREQPESVSRPVLLPNRRTWRLVASGAAALVLAANFMPVGLLSPVEAYTPPTGWGAYVSGSQSMTESPQQPTQAIPSLTC